MLFLSEACPCGGQGAGALRGTFVAPGGRPRTGPTGLKALENDQGHVIKVGVLVHSVCLTAIDMRQARSAGKQSNGVVSFQLLDIFCQRAI